MFIIYIFYFCYVKNKKGETNNSTAFVKKRHKKQLLKTYEGLTVNADLPEQL